MKIVDLRIKPKKEKKEPAVSVAKGVDDHEDDAEERIAILMGQGY